MPAESLPLVWSRTALVWVWVMLRPMVSRLICLGIKHPSGAYDQIFITVRQLRVCWCGALSLTRGRVCRLRLLLALASAVILVSVILSQIRDVPFRHLLRLAEIRCRYSTPPPHGADTSRSQSQSYITTDGEPASLSWNKAPIWGLRPDLDYCLTVACLLVWGALSDERTGLPFAIAPGPRQPSHFRVRVP
jgi:hypothetical protein